MSQLFSSNPGQSPAGRRFTTYRSHNCTAKHRSFRAFAKCVWKRAYGPDGDGAWATISTCRPGVMTVALHETKAEAERSMDLIRSSGCGGACRLKAAEGANKHRLIRLVLE